jgi:hypothetical protein
MRNLLLTVYQHGGDDVTCKPRIRCDERAVRKRCKFPSLPLIRKSLHRVTNLLCFVTEISLILILPGSELSFITTAPLEERDGLCRTVLAPDWSSSSSEEITRAGSVVVTQTSRFLSKRYWPGYQGNTKLSNSNKYVLSILFIEKRWGMVQRWYNDISVKNHREPRPGICAVIYSNVTNLLK